MTRVTTARRWRLTRRPEGALAAGQFALETVTLPALTAGEVLTRTLFLSLDPYLALRMRAFAGEEPGWDRGIITGRVIAEVRESTSPGLKPGDIVLGLGRWADFDVLDAAKLERIDPAAAPLTTRLGILGRSGLTAWVGMHLAEPKHGQTFLVSAATGPVGSVAGQIAKLRGCRALGVAGGAEKCRHAVEALGFDACLDHRDPGMEAALAAAAPDGIDILFENVGAVSLDPALALMRFHGRILLCGLAAHYDDDAPLSFRNFRNILSRRLSLRAFATADYPELFAQGLRELTEWIAHRQLRYDETLVDGLEQAPEAFIAMLSGEGLGKRIIRLA